MAKSSVITTIVLLIGVGILSPFRVFAQESGGDLVEHPGVEAAPPADSLDSGAYQLFPRAAIQDDATESFSSFESDTTGRALEADPLSFDSGSITTPEMGAWEATERFSRRNFIETIPVQYPLDDSAYEGEDPAGDDPENGQGDWRRSSVNRPNEQIPLEDQPWVDWYKISLLTQTLPSGADGLGMTSLDLRGTLKFARWPFLFVTPRTGLHVLSGPTSLDVPAKLFDYSLDTTIYLPLNDRWTVQASAAPSLFSDMNEFKNSFRMVGRGLVFYRWSPELQLAGGFVYLGRKDIVALPAAGFIYTPNDDLKVDIMFPKPRVGYRYHHNEERERWVYVSGELGGGSWAAQRSSGAADVLTYRDFQLLLGIEHKQTKALNWQLEGGYVFNRKVEYFSSSTSLSLPSSAVLRVVLSF